MRGLSYIAFVLTVALMLYHVTAKSHSKSRSRLQSRLMHDMQVKQELMNKIRAHKHIHRKRTDVKKTFEKKDNVLLGVHIEVCHIFGL